jgi:hypothetical protein
MRRHRLLFFVICVLCASLVRAQEATPETDDITLPAYEGYISVAGRYFVDEAGQGFLVIGQNDAISWPGLVTLFDGSSREATVAYVRDLRAHGVTVSRIMIEYAQFPDYYMENPVGTFSENVLNFWDEFIAIAEQEGLYLLLTPYDTFWQSDQWETYPYNATMGGPCATRSDWLTGAACIEAQKARWRVIIDRWGDSPNIFAWDVMNEIDLWWEASNTEIETYIDEMAAFVREYETAQHGRTRLITVSSAAAVPEGRLGRVIYRHELLDFANTHLYLGDIGDPADPVMPGLMMAGGVLRSLEAIEDDRPYFDSESGPISDWIIDVRFDQEYHHNMSWGHLMACGAGSGMRWPYTNPHYILPELRDNLLGLARFAATIDWAAFASDNISSQIQLDRRDVFRVGCASDTLGILWLLADTRQDQTVTPVGTTLTVAGVFADGTYTVEYWETYQGSRLTTETVTVTEGVLTLTVPSFEVDLRDVALMVRANAD